MSDYTRGNGDVLLTGPFANEIEVLQEFAILEEALAKAKAEALRAVR